MAPSCVLHESSTAGNLVSDMCSGFFQDILLPATVAICLKSLWYPFYCQEQGYRNSTAYSEQVNMSLLELTLWMLLNQSTNSLNSFLKKCCDIVEFSLFWKEFNSVLKLLNSTYSTQFLYFIFHLFYFQVMSGASAIVTELFPSLTLFLSKISCSIHTTCCNPSLSCFSWNYSSSIVTQSIKTEVLLVCEFWWTIR